MSRNTRRLRRADPVGSRGERFEADLHNGRLGVPSKQMSVQPTPAGVPATQNQAPLVEMRGVTVTFKRVVAVNRAELTVGAGEVIGLLGNSGAGKTTLIKALVGLLPISEGEVRINGRAMWLSSPQEARTYGIETAYQDLALLEDLSIARNFFLGHEPLTGRRPFRRLSHRQMVRHAQEVFDVMGMSEMPAASRLVAELSGGQRQLLALARALYFGRQLVLLDEPTAALSDNQIEMVLGQIEQARARGTAVVFVTHKAHEVFNIADRFVVLDRGRTLMSVPHEQTSLKEMEKLLISSRFTMVQEMAAAVAHQFRNPLGIMRVSAEMLRDDFEVTDRREHYDRLLNMIIDELCTLETLITNYLDFARQRNLRRERVALSALIQDAVAQLSEQSVDPARLILEVPEELPEVTIDKDLMEQVVLNLVSNAAEASGEEQPVVISAGKNGTGNTWVAVQDFGCGMDERTRKMIFNPFFSTKTRGTGLGLSIVHRIVEQHGGTIEVVSELNQGTTFIISLPVEEE